MTGTNKENPDNMKETFGLFLKQTDVNYTFTNIVCTDLDDAFEIASLIMKKCNVTCVIVDESFSIKHA